MSPAERRRAVILAGHRAPGYPTALAHDALDDDDPDVRVAAIGALDRLGTLDDAALAAMFADRDPGVRRRASRAAASRPHLSLLVLLDDDDATVVEVAAWACGEQETVDDDVLARIIELTTNADDPLVRESCAAALGAIGDIRGLPAVLAACTDKPHIRRRAVLALAPFEGPEVEAAIDAALSDRDWQVRQGAEDLRRGTGAIEVE